MSSGHSTESAAEALQTRDDTARDNQPTSKNASADYSETTLGSIDRFELQHILGEGGFGIVYRAFDPTLKRHVALKTPKFSTGDTNKSKRFLTEAHAAAHLQHTNIVAVFESGQAEDRLFIVSEYVQGEPLSTRTGKPPADFKPVARWMRAVADALAYAHREGVVHRDIKPDNIMLTAKGRPLIMDFGLARLTHEDSQVTDDGSILGTPAYMSPEQARGDSDQVGPHSDQYCLGVVLYELLTGERPFQGAPHHVIAQVVSEEPRELRNVNPAVPQDLAAICQKAMEKEPDRRYADMSAMAEDLDRWLDGRETLARPLSLLEKARRRYRKNPAVGRLWVTVGMLATLCLIVGTIDYARTKLIVNQQTSEFDDAVSGRIEAQRALAINEFERGRNLCEQGQLNHGLLWLARSINNLTPEMQDLERPIRSYIGSWMPHIHRLEHILPHNQPITDMAVTPDDQTLLVASGNADRIFTRFGELANFGQIGDGAVHRWNLASGTDLGDPITHDSVATCVAVAPDGSFAVSGGLDNLLKFFDPRTGREIREPLSHPHGITAVAFNNDGTQLATACLDENVRVWDTATWILQEPTFNLPRRHPGEIYHNSINPVPYVEGLAFSADDGILFIRGRRLDHSPVRIRDLTTGESRSLPESLAALANTPISFSDDGQQVVLYDSTEALRFHDWAAGAPLPELSIEDHDDISDFAIDRDGQLVLTGGTDHSAWTYDAQRGRKVGQTLFHDEMINSVVLASRGQRLVTSGFDHTVKVWQAAAERPWGTPVNLTRGWHAKFLPDGDSFFTSTRTEPNDLHAEHGAGDMEQFFDTRTLEPITRPFLGPGVPTATDFSKDGVLLARGNWNSLTFHSRTTEDAMGLPIGHPNHVTAVIFVDDGTVVITGCHDGLVRFFDVETQQLLGEPIKHSGPVEAIDVTADERYLAISGKDGNVRIWDMASRSPASEPISHRKSVRSLSLHPTANILATACDDGAIRFWTVPDGHSHGPALTNIGLGISDVFFHPDGTQFITGSRSAGVSFWDLETLLPTSRPMMHGTWFSGADIHPRGHRLLTWGYDFDHKDVFFRRLGAAITGTPEEVQSLIESTLGMQLNDEEGLQVLDADQWQERRQ